MSKTIEYLGPFRPPWANTAPLKIVTYIEPSRGIDQKANLQFVIDKDRLCLCKNVPDDPAFKLTNSSPVFIEFVPGTKYSEKRIVGLKPTKVNQEDKLQDELSKVQKELEDERKKNAINAQQVALQREAEAQDNPPPPPIEAEGSDSKEVEKEELMGHTAK